MARPLIAIAQLRYADLLASYLTAQKIAVSVVQKIEQQQYVLMLEDEDQYDHALAMCQEFVKQPNNPKYQAAAWQHSQRTDIPIAPLSPRGFKRWVVAMKRAPFAAAILVVCTLVFVASLLGFLPAIAAVLQILPLSELVDSQQWWRLIGPAFIHFSALHFIFNLLWWGMLGSQIERTFGSVFLGVLFLLTALISNLVQLLVAGPNFGGLSGVVYGLVGFVWITGVLKPNWGLMMPTPVIGFMLVWLLLGYADVLWVNMANGAHTAGLLSGCILAWLLSIGAGKIKAPAHRDNSP